MDRIKYDESLEEAAMRIIVQPLLDEQLAEFEELNQPRVFSERLERELEKIFRRDAMRQRLKTAALWGKRVAVCLMIVLTLALVACAAIEPLREKVANAFLTWYDEYIDVKFEMDETNKSIAKVLTEPPQGFDLISVSDELNQLTMFYEDAEGHGFVFKRGEYFDNWRIRYDYLNVNFDEVLINGIEGLHSFTEGNSSHILTWLDGEYLYEIHAEVPLDELLKAASSVK